MARLAGVGVATVDRVLNERGNVSPVTARRVIEAARQLDLKRVLPRPYARRVRIEVLLPRPDAPFLARLTEGFGAVAATLDRAVILQRTTLADAAPAKSSRRGSAPPGPTPSSSTARTTPRSRPPSTRSPPPAARSSAW